jgi:hypothetical protein
MGKTWFGLEK